MASGRDDISAAGYSGPGKPGGRGNKRIINAKALKQGECGMCVLGIAKSYCDHRRVNVLGSF